jgi:Leucine-rich repeat (LRR) protein
MLNRCSLRFLLKCRFTSLPNVLYTFPKLEILLASNNQIAEIDPVGLKSLPQLATLDLQNNDIRQVPPELGEVTQLRYEVDFTF